MNKCLIVGHRGLALVVALLDFSPECFKTRIHGAWIHEVELEYLRILSGWHPIAGMSNTAVTFKVGGMTLLVQRCLHDRLDVLIRRSEGMVDTDGTVVRSLG